MDELARRATTPAKAVKTSAKKTAAKKVPAKKAAKKVPAKKAAKKTAAKKAAKRPPPHKAHHRHPHKKAGKSHAANGNAAAAAQSPSAQTRGPAMGLPALPAPPDDPLVVLGLTEPLHPNELRSAWRVFAARHHPDRGGDAVTFARGQRAYDLLKGQLRRPD